LSGNFEKIESSIIGKMRIFNQLFTSWLVALVSLTTLMGGVNAQEVQYSEKTGQAVAPPTQTFGAEAFGKIVGTEIRWLGNSSFLINSRGTTVMIDPVLKGFDMPLLIKIPIEVRDVPRLDAVLITHVDGDHYSLPTCQDIASVTKVFHSTHYVDSLMTLEGFPSSGHDIKSSFRISNLNITLTPALHNWQDGVPELRQQRYYKEEDYCGFWIETPEGTIWATGDSKLLPEHLNMPTPDVILFDFSDNEWHFTLEGAVKLANAYPNAELLLHHWGTVDAPDFSPFNADPADLHGKIVNPDRIRILAPGEPFLMKRR
jgi:L-ascorbate metabolism protein UlaG (beta-lactamase superfamily)